MLLPPGQKRENLVDERPPGPRPLHGVSATFLCALLSTSSLPLVASPLAHAQVTTITQTTGTGDLGTIITPPQPGNVYTITGGFRPNGSPILFHSFGQFDLGQTNGINDIANFFNDTGTHTTNIIGRVTDSSLPSQIYGTIQIDPTFGSANLFLMNPSGFVFGPTASLHVGGAVSFTTAQYIRLFDFSSTTNFYANPANDGLPNSVLTIDPSAFVFASAIPISYGFLTPPAPDATITVQGSTLDVPDGQSIWLVGGKVVIQGAQLQDGTIQPAQLLAPNGRIMLATAASPGEFSALTLQPLQSAGGARFESSGSIALEAGSTINVHDANTVWIKGGQLVLTVNDATLNTSGGSVEGETVILGPGSLIKTFGSGTGSGPELQLTAPNIQMIGASVRSEAEGVGVGGDIIVNADHVTMMQESKIETSTLGEGSGGNIRIQGLSASEAESVEISGQTKVATESSGSGTAGEISITARSLNVNGFSTVTSSSFGPGSNGNIIISVQDAHLSNGGSIKSVTNFSSPEGTAGGSITVQGLEGTGNPANSLTLDRSGIITQTGGTGRLGDIEVTAKTVRLTNEAVIQAGTPTDFATAGNIRIAADSVNISGGSSISSHAFALEAGKINITATTQLSLDHSQITTNTSSPTGGRGGDVLLSAGSVSLTNGALIDSSTSGGGQSGNISIRATGSGLMTDGSSLRASSTGSGDAGSITVQANTVTLANDSEISSSSTGTATGNAGSITVEGLASPANTVSITDSALLTRAEGTGHGGSIRVDTTNLTLNNATLSASVNDFNTLDASDGPAVGTGNISFSAKYVTMKDSHTTAESLGTRNAGNILMNSKAAPGTRFLMENSTMNTSASQADGGNIQLYFTDMIRLTDSIITSSVGNPVKKETVGGNITIDPDFFLLQRSQVRANAFAGTGGAIDITAGLFLADATSIVDASSTLGLSGTVEINAPINNLSEVIARLPESLVEVQALLRAACAARMAQGETSSFVERGRDSIPTGPEGFLASPYIPVASSSVARTQAPPSIGIFGFQLRRMPIHEPPAPVMILSENAACSS